MIVSGSGRYEGTRLESKSAKVLTSGSGDAIIKVIDKLEATVSGSGSVQYIGNPTVTKHDTGSGEVVQLRGK